MAISRIVPEGLEVTVNVAQSLNGYISGPGGRTAMISSLQDQERVHRLRSSVDGILVGANTVINDDPDLTARLPSGEIVRPTRIILDAALKIPDGSRVLDTRSRTIVFTSNHSRKLNGAELVAVHPDELSLPAILERLSGMGLKSILVEGGANVISGFVSSRLIDRFYLFIGNVIIPEGGIRLFSMEVEIRDVVREARVIDGGVLMELYPEKLVNKI